MSREPEDLDVPLSGVEAETSIGDVVHPIEIIAGQAVGLTPLLEATLSDGDRALSMSTRTVLERAARSPIGETVDNIPVVGLASVVKAVLTIGVELGSGTWTLATTVVDYFAAGDPAVRAQFAGFVPANESLAAPVSAVVDRETTAALADAAALVRQLSPGQVRIDVTHAIIAVLRSAGGQRAIQQLGLLGTNPSERLERLADTVVGYLSSHTEFNPQAAPDVRASLATPQIRLALETTSPSTYVADAPARALADDRLGMAADARALAEVVCLREPGPPLAIGLFGDWGSGKSTFMNLIEAGIEELTERTHRDPAAAATLVSNVIHIRFNAWHYNDDNLWASLTSEFFAQLRSGGHEKSANRSYTSLVSDVMKAVATLDEQTTNTAEQAVRARDKALDLRKTQEQLERQRQHVTADALGQTARGLVRTADEHELDRAERTLTALGHRVRPAAAAGQKQPDLDKRRDAVAEAAAHEIEAAATLAGEVATYLRAAAHVIFTFSDGPAVALAGLAIMVVLLIAALPIPWDVMQRSAVATMGFLVLAGTAAGRVYRLIEPFLRAGREFARQRRTLAQDLDRKIAANRDELAAAEKAQRAAEQQRAQSAAQAARLRGATPERVLDYYLNLSADTRQFDQQLGTVSRVRRVFEQLNAIYEKRGKLQGDMALANAENGVAPEAGNGAERIVLYIDDLDRCQADQVVRVLEAVHLLLAFPLFVVVVGVDARWLQQSLATFYEKQLKGSVTGERHIATVQDYLEKIFQVPIRLEPIASGPPERFGTSLEAIAGPIEAPAAVADPQTTAGDQQAGKAATVLTPVDLRMKPLETAPETVQRITIRREELEMMTALAPILGKSPRAVKRFMNVYRLLRGRRRGAALDEFLSGGNGAPPLYPAYQLWLAIEMGLSPGAAAQYQRVFTQSKIFHKLPGLLAADDGFLNSEEKPFVLPLRQEIGVSNAMGHAAALKAVQAVLVPDNLNYRPAMEAARLEVVRFTVPRWWPAVDAARIPVTGASV